MTSPEVLFGVAAAAAVLALWAAVFATRADRAARRALNVADIRWEAMTKPVPHLTFQNPPAAGQTNEVAVQELRRTPASGGGLRPARGGACAGGASTPAE